MKINDWNLIHEEFEDVNKQIDKSKMLIMKHGLPGFYVKMLMDVEDFVKVTLANKDAVAKMKPVISRALNRMKLVARRHNQRYEAEIARCREHPEEFRDPESAGGKKKKASSDSSDSSSDSDSDSDSSSSSSSGSSSGSESESDDSSESSSEVRSLAILYFCIYVARAIILSINCDDTPFLVSELVASERRRRAEITDSRYIIILSNFVSREPAYVSSIFILYLVTYLFSFSFIVS